MTVLIAPTTKSIPLATENEPLRRRWTRDEYYRAGEIGLFSPEEKLELIKGEVYQKMSPQGTPHSIGTSLSAYAMYTITADLEVTVRSHMPITLPDDSEPEPDIAVARGLIRDYEQSHPQGEDILLIIEVADTTLAFDRNVKSQIYAEVGIPEYWLLNLQDRVLERRCDPQAGTYHSQQTFAETESVSPPFAPNATIRIVDLLPSPPSDAT